MGRFMLLWVLTIAFCPTACENDKVNAAEPVADTNQRLRIIVGKDTLTAVLYDNPTVKDFISRLPITADMSEMQGNEKYFYLSEGLPVGAFSPGTIRAGDLMLYGSACVVLFYETFSTPYSYTRLGRVDEPSRLPSVLGAGSVTVVFELL